MSAYWLVKTEASVYSIDDFKRDKSTVWGGVRNYQARNLLKQMKVGDRVFFYHSVEEPTGIVGLAQVQKGAYPDPTQFDRKSEYFDVKSSKEVPRWFAPDLKFVKKFAKPLSLSSLRERKELKDMLLLKRGMRLSVQPVTAEQYKVISELLK